MTIDGVDDREEMLITDESFDIMVWIRDLRILISFMS